VPESYSKNTIDIISYWNENGISNAKFIPTIGSSKHYYLSHPPFSYYFLYAFQKLTGFKSYYVLNSILVSISAFFIYLTITLLSVKQAKKDFSIYGWIGMILYLSAYPILRFQYFNYHPDIFVLTALIASQYVFLKLLMKERYRSLKYIFLISILLIIINYSSWFGVVFSFIISLIAIFNLRKGYRLFPYILIAIFITGFSTLFTFSQYAYFGGWKNVFYYFSDTYLRESPLYGNLKQTSLEIFFHIFKNLWVFILSLICLVIYSSLSKKRKFLFTKNGYRYLVLSLFPTVLYSILLIQYFQNNFACLYFVPPLIITICIWLEKIFQAENSRRNLLKIVLLIVLSNLSLFAVL